MKMKRWIALFLSVTLLVGMLPMAAFAEPETDLPVGESDLTEGVFEMPAVETEQLMKMPSMTGTAVPEDDASTLNPDDNLDNDLMPFADEPPTPPTVQAAYGDPIFPEYADVDFTVGATVNSANNRTATRHTNVYLTQQEISSASEIPLGITVSVTATTDPEQCLYHFRREGATVSFTVTGKLPLLSAVGNAESSEPNSITLETGSAGGSFYLKSDQKYLAMRMPTEDNDSAPGFVWTENLDYTDCSMLIFKKDAENLSPIRPCILAGYTLVRSSTELTDEGSYLIGTVRDEVLYLMQPQEGSAERFSAHQIQSNITLELDEGVAGNKVYTFDLGVLSNAESGGRTGFVHCIVTVLGQVNDTPGSESYKKTRDVDVTLDISEDEINRLTYVDSSGDYSKMSAPAGWTKSSDGRYTKGSITMELRNVPAANSNPLLLWNNENNTFSSEVTETITSCLYRFVSAGDNTQDYYIASQDKHLYLNITGGINSMGAHATRVAAKNDGSFAFSDGDIHLSFSHTGFTSEDDPDAEQGWKFYLYRSVDSGKIRQIYENSDIESGGAYLIVATRDDQDFYLLRPVMETGSNEDTAKIDTSQGYFFDSTAISFSATQVTEDAITVQVGYTEYHVTARNSYAATEKSESEKTYDLTIARGKSRAFLELPGACINQEPVWNQATQEMVLAEVERKNHMESYILHHDGSGSGGAANYSRNEEELSKCLYTATVVDEANHIYTFRANGVYLRVDRTPQIENEKSAGGFPGTTVSTQVKVLGDKGIFQFSDNSSDEYRLAFRRNGWGVFFSKAVRNNAWNWEENGKYTAADCNFRLYRRVSEGKGSDELPGYARVTDGTIQNGEQYIIAALYDGNFYILYPSTSTASRNAHVVKAAKQYTSGTHSITFTGLKSTNDSVVTATFGGNTYHIRVTETGPATSTDDCFLGQEGAASGCVVKKVTLSLGKTYRIKASQLPSGAHWLSSDDSIATFDVVEGTTDTIEIKAVSTGNGYFGRAFIGYYSEGQSEYKAVEVITVDTYKTTDTRKEEVYVDTLDNVDAWALWMAPEKEDKPIISPSDFKKAELHEVVQMTFDNDTHHFLSYFAKPKQDYALTIMSATVPNGNYDSVSGVVRAEDTDYYTKPGAAVQNYINSRDDDPEPRKKLMKDAIQYVMDELGGTGAMGFNFYPKGGDKSVKLYFGASKLPSVQKKVLGFTPKEKVEQKDTVPYNEGESVVHEGDVIHFMITVNAPENAGINYSVAEVQDTLAKASFSGYQIDIVDSSGTSTIGKIVKFGEDNIYTEENPVTGNGNTDHTLSVVTKEGKPSVDLTNLLNSHNADTVTVKLYVNYTVSNEDVRNIGEGKYLENTAKLSYKYKTKFDNSAQDRDTNARAILRVAARKYMKYVNLSLDGSIGVNVFFGPEVEISEEQENSDAAKSDSYYIWKNTNQDNSYTTEHTGNSKPKYYLVCEVYDGEKVVRRTVTAFRNGQPSIVENKPGMKFSIDVPPQNMASEIRVYIQDERAERVTEQIKFTVKDYAKVILTQEEKLITSWQYGGIPFSYATSSYASLKTMVSAMLHYGAATQQYLNYHTDNLPNGVQGIETIPQPESVPKNDVILSNDSDSGVTFTGMALQLTAGTMNVRVYFQCDSTKVDLKNLQAESSFIAQNHAGTAFQYTFQNRIYQDEHSNFYIVINDVASNWLSNTYQVTITNHGKSSSVQLSAVSYAALLYSLTAENSGMNETELNALKALGNAMHAYSNAASAYFNVSGRPNIPVNNS